MNPTTSPRSETLVRGGRVPSADGTTISYLTRGSGPVILVIHGGLGSALSLQPLAGHLADEFEVAAMNCRGHGTSQWGQSPPNIAREVEDVLAAPERIPKLALFEPPLPVTYPIPDPALIETAIAAGDYEQLLLDATPGSGGFSPAELAAVRDDPLWLSKVAHAPTLIPTMQVLSGLSPTVDQYTAVTTPTKLMVGTTSAPYILDAADLLADALPDLTREVLHGQGHHADHQLLARSLAAFVRR